MLKEVSFAAIATALILSVSAAVAQDDSTKTTVLFENVRVFDGTGSALGNPTNVLIKGNMIDAIGPDVTADGDATIIAGDGRTLMPGLSDCHWHTMQSSVTNIELLTRDHNYVAVAMVLGIERVLMQGITTIRDAGGNVFGIKAMIDEGRIPGPRILPSGAFLTQTSGHADFRFPNVLPRKEGRELIDPEILGYTATADGVDAVRRRARENFMKGATQLKVMAGGGVSSFADPLDVAQYSDEELRAAVEEADNWNTYVMVHTYTPKAIQHALDAGVRSIEHGQMMDEETARMIAEKDVWVCMQPFLDDQDRIPFKPGSFSEQKYNLLLGGVDNAYKLAKQYGIKIGFGTDFQNNPDLIDRQAAQIPKLTRWFKPAEVLRIATSGNQTLFKLSGPRHPYQKGPLGVVVEGAYADLLLVDGDPLADIDLIADPHKNFKIIMKDGVIYKNTLN
ncbi:metal-dependent hydrolase family protein [Rhodobium gokarnense]|uniref:Imidazolonepropionase-like amidohydrolase n=1 Tax=Rhodobium gokarnense TaxID=364296 RepID=A0ABT3HCK6_9HYPH|nr:amidohydrolase family protein [Rhodobium gokarnense]MCW2308011.1 imidazolonepropionase-like amidohydrolase [Rhodobium gokarnense]